MEEKLSRLNDFCVSFTRLGDYDMSYKVSGDVVQLTLLQKPSGDRMMWLFKVEASLQEMFDNVIQTLVTRNQNNIGVAS